jgi:hypothetical protein
MNRESRVTEQLVALFLLGALLLLPPVLLVFNRPVRVLGLPVLYLYVFAAWAMLIALTAAIAVWLTREDGVTGERSSPATAEQHDTTVRARDA